jgi:hypothetical protein
MGPRRKNGRPRVTRRGLTASGFALAAVLALGACGSAAGSSGQPVASSTSSSAVQPSTPDITAPASTVPATSAPAAAAVPNTAPCRELSVGAMSSILGHPVQAYNQPRPALATSCFFGGGPNVSDNWTYGATLQYRCGSDGQFEYQALLGESDRMAGSGVTMVDNGSWFFAYLNNHCLIMISPNYNQITGVQLNSSYPAVISVLVRIVAHQPAPKPGGTPNYDR